MFINPFVHSRGRSSAPVVAAILAGTLGTLDLASAADITLPASAALPTTSTLGPAGFTVRTALAPAESVLANSYLRALKQLDGSLLDSSGTPYGNVAVPGGNPDGSYDLDLINFSLTPDGDYGMFASPDYGDSLFPGLFEESPTKHFATEVVTFLNLPAGTYTFGITAQNDRTDVNDDDGWKLYTGLNARSFFATPVAEFQHSTPPFTVNKQGNTNEFNVTVPVSGIYPFRLTYWQTEHGAQLEWYLVIDPASEFPTRLLLNDPSAAYAYRSVAVPEANGPYISSISPQPDSSGVSPSTAVEAVLVDGERPIDLATVKLYLNDNQVIPQSLVRDGRYLRLKYSPNAARSNPENKIRVEFKDTAGVAVTNTWNFAITISGAPRTVVRGQWDFDNRDLSATTGKALRYFDRENDGFTAGLTQFGTTTEFGISDIDGQPAKVMRVPGDLDNRVGYIMEHGIAPNGGGTKVNQYTLIFDIYVETAGPGAASLIQISDVNNPDREDGDLFWQGSNFGQGTDGYKGTGAFTAGGWHRVCAAYDLGATPPVVTKYVDGIKQDDWTAGQQLDAPRRALQPTAVLFADGDHDERRVMYVNSIQIREGKLSDGEMALLGGPSASGIPQDLPSVNVAGQWDFDRADLSATAGKALRYFDRDNDGFTAGLTQYGTTTEFGISDIDGQPARVIRVPGDLDNRVGYIMEHGISPNGGGTKVNQYTIIFDIYVDPSGPGAASLIQISDVTNPDREDGDLFWQGSNFGQGTDGYKGTGAFTAGAWHRVCAAYDLAATPPVVTKYVDGIKQDDWTTGQQLDAPRRALQSTAVLFADGDHDERRVMYVNSIQIRPGKLSDAQLALLGGPKASGIPLVIPTSTVAGQWDFDSKDLRATVGKDLEYFDIDTGGGLTGLTKTLTQFGTTTEFGIDGIQGEEAMVMRVPGDLDNHIGYVMTHRIAPNGGGSKVNQYTLIFDLYVETSGPGAASLIQISDLQNGEREDGDLFWQGSNFGQGTDGYKGTGAFTAGGWHRVSAAYNLAANPPVVTKYVDGIFQDDWTTGQQLDAPRRALQPSAILFADGDHDERRVMYVNSIQIRAGALSKLELEALGGPSASGIPLALPPRLTAAAVGGGAITLSWPAFSGNFVLESATDLAAPNWQAVAGVANNAVTIPTSGAGAFFRLRQL